MSTPENPLAKFRTYSYHHVLVVCAGTGAAEAIATNNNFDAFLNVQRVDSQGNPAVQTADGEGYIVLIDGRASADFVLEEIHWDMLMVPSSGQETTQGATSLNVAGTMTVIEPRGVNFLNVLATASDLLSTDYASMVYVLKTYFVGYGVAGTMDTNTPEHISNIRPMMFLMVNIAATFDHSGSEYKIDIRGLSNGAAKLPHVSRAADLVNMSINSQQTVGQALTKLSRYLDCLADEAYKRIQEVGKQANAQGPVGTKVKFKILFDAIYSDQSYLVDTASDTSTSTGQRDTVLTSGQSGSTESAIDRIMHLSSRVLDDAVGKGPNGVGGNKKFIYKINTTRSTKITPGVLTEIYRVSRHQLPVVLSTNASKQSVGSGLADGNSITFDYFFTGKNIDILEFDMKADNAISYLQTVTSSNSIPIGNTGAGSAVEQGAGKTRGYIENTPTNNIKKFTPIYPDTKMDDVLYRNTTNSKRAIGFAEQLSAYAGYFSINSRIKIIGNIALLDNTSSLPSEIAAGKLTSTTVGANVAQSWQGTPTIVKINISMPASSSVTNTGPFTKFWFDGLYFLKGLTNSFQGGEFTQTLDLLALITDSPLAAVSENKEVASQVSATGGTTVSPSERPPPDPCTAATVGNAAAGDDADQTSALTMLDHHGLAKT